MKVEVNKVSVNLSYRLLNQVQEATMRDIEYAIEHGTILGYINSVGIDKKRVFLLTNESDYRIVTNHQWESVIGDVTKLTTKNGYRRDGTTKCLTKLFSSEAAKINFLELFDTVKKVALKTHIYI